MPRKAPAETPDPDPEDQAQPPPEETPSVPPETAGHSEKIPAEQVRDRVALLKRLRPQPSPVDTARPWGGSDRFEKFTERAKKVLVLAQDEAQQRFNHNYIGTEHLLLGLVAEGEGVAATVLKGLKVSLDEVRANVEFIIGRGDRPVTGNISLTPRSKKVIELAIDESRRLNHNYVGTEHLLLGLIREGEGIAAGILQSLGVDFDKVRKQIIQVVGQSGRPGLETSGGVLPDITAPKDNVITCRIDSGDLEALDALVEAGIRSTRSDAAAWLIHAGIQANLDLFDKVYATVADIRRLREQAQSAAKDLESKGRPPRDQSD